MIGGFGLEVTQGYIEANFAKSHLKARAHTTSHVQHK